MPCINYEELKAEISEQGNIFRATFRDVEGDAILITQFVKDRLENTRDWIQNYNDEDTYTRSEGVVYHLSNLANLHRMITNDRTTDFELIEHKKIIGMERELIEKTVTEFAATQNIIQVFRNKAGNLSLSEGEGFAKVPASDNFVAYLDFLDRLYEQISNNEKVIKEFSFSYLDAQNVVVN